MLISLWQIVITAFWNAVEDFSLFPGFPFHRCRRQKNKNPFRTYVNILSKYDSPAFKPQSTLHTVGCCSRKCTRELLCFIPPAIKIKLNDWDTILPWGCHEANSLLVFIFALGHNGRCSVRRFVTVSCVHHSFRSNVLDGEGRMHPKKRLPS